MKNDKSEVKTASAQKMNDIESGRLFLRTELRFLRKHEARVDNCITIAGTWEYYRRWHALNRSTVFKLKVTTLVYVATKIC